MANKSVGLLTIAFGADLRGFEKSMKKAQRSIKKFGTSMQRTGKNLTSSLTLPLLALGAASLRNFDIQAKAIAQVEAGLKSTGNQVGITSKQLQQMAADLQTKTLFGDEEILKNATAQLLTFTNIAGVQFKKTQEIALDLATRLDGDLKSASIMLGKALNDPVANLSALSRAGIQFSTDQKQTIKSLVETNRLADAQTIILKELEKQYGGSAKAAAKAGLGPIKQLGMTLSDMSEDIGKILLPSLTKLADKIKELATKFDNLNESSKKNIVKYGLILAAIGPVLIIVGKLSLGIVAVSKAVMGLSKAFGILRLAMLANPITAIVLGLATGVALLVANLGTMDIATKKSKKLYDDLIETKEKLKKLNDEELKSLKARTLIELETLGAELKIAKQKATDAAKKVPKGNSMLLGADLGDSDNGQSAAKFQLKETSDALTEVQNKYNKQFNILGLINKSLKENNAIIIGETGEGTDEIENQTEKWETYYEVIEEGSSEASQAQERLSQVFGYFGDVLSSAMTSAAHSQEGFFKSFIKNIKQAIKSLLIQLAVMVAIAMIMGKADTVGAALKLATSNIFNFDKAVPMANGGLFTGASLALVGEGAGTSASNPEVVAPLDKLKGMINNNGGGGKVEVYGRISGNDIFISNQRGSINRQRSV